MTLWLGDKRLQLYRLSEPATENNIPSGAPGQSREEVGKHGEEICTHGKPVCACMWPRSLALVRDLRLQLPPGLNVLSVQVNGTACAIPRIIVSLLENYQQEVQ